MVVNKLFKFLSGYVILSLKGISIERFINICVRRGIPLLGISKSTRGEAVISVYMRDMARLRGPAFKTRTRIRIREKRGLPMLMRRFGRRYALAAGAAAVAAVLICGSRFIWIVDYEGAENIDRAALEKIVTDMGVYPGALKSALPGAGEMKTTILSGTNDLVWAWVYIKGARALVSVRAKEMPPGGIDKSVPCDVVAMFDGVVKSVTGKAGDVRVKRGDVVSRGDVLIAGTIDSENGYRLVHALGEVRASVFKSESGEYKLYEDVRRPNGTHKMLFGVTLFSHEFVIGGSAPESEYDISENTFGTDTPAGAFAVRTVRAEGVDAYRRERTPDETRAAALYELEEKISRTLTPGSVLLRKEAKTERIDDDTVLITLEAEFEESIGLEKEIMR